MARRIPSLQALNCFEAAARHESYTRAAAELALTQSAVSRQIATLEGYLGVALFRRTRHGVALTAEGQAYARQVGQRLDGLERDTLEAMARQSVGGVLRLATVPTFATRWLLPRLPDLQAHHPELTLHLDTRTRPFLFAETEFDAALYAGTPEQVANWPGVRATLLMQEETVPVASPALLSPRSTWTPADVASLPLLQQSTRPQAWQQWFEAMGVSAPEAMRGPRYELFSMLAMGAAHGLGAALVPRMLVEDELRRGELVVACDRPLRGRRAYVFVTPDIPNERPAVAALRAWLSGQAASG